MTELNARKLLREAGWTYGGMCACIARIQKYKKGNYTIKLFLSSRRCALYFHNITMMYEPIDNLDKLIERHEAEA